MAEQQISGMDDLRAAVTALQEGGGGGGAGPEGPAGPQGPAGPAGPAGPVNITRAEFDALVARVDALEEG